MCLVPSHVPKVLWAPAWPHSSCVTLGREFCHLMPQFPHLSTGDDKQLSSIWEDSGDTWLVSMDLPPGLRE